MLIITAGLPGTGKTTLSRLLAHKLGATHIRIDTIEAVLINLEMKVGHAGYGVAFALAKGNLNLGLTVIADSVNPLNETRSLWRDVAKETGVPFKEVEIICSDLDEHKQRVESRRIQTLEAAHIDTTKWQPPAWQDVMSHEVEPWTSEHLILDTAGQTTKKSFQNLSSLLGVSGR